MGYRGDDLADLAAPLERATTRMARRTVKDAGERVAFWAKRHTPYAKPGAAANIASYANSGEFIRARGGRRPGTMANSWRVGTATIGFEGRPNDVWTVEVWSDDEKAQFVEWDTAPHLIVPKKPGGALRFPTTEGMRFAKIVHHPGTRGVHMFATAIAKVAASWQVDAEETWRELTRTVWTASA